MIEVKPSFLRYSGKLQESWGELADAIRCGAELREGDYKEELLNDGKPATFIVTEVTDEYVRFDSKDCIGDSIMWRSFGMDGIYMESGPAWCLDNIIPKMLPEGLLGIISETTRKLFLPMHGKLVEHRYASRLFLPAVSEVFSPQECVSVYGTGGLVKGKLYPQLKYYKDIRNRIKEDNGNPCPWWMASSILYEIDGSMHVKAVGINGQKVDMPTESPCRMPVCFTIRRK